jgi:hypothetical protein
MIPDLKPFTSDTYSQPSSSDAEMQYMEQLWLANREKEFIEKRFEQEIIDQKKQMCFEKMKMK